MTKIDKHAVPNQDRFFFLKKQLTSMFFYLETQSMYVTIIEIEIKHCELGCRILYFDAKQKSKSFTLCHMIVFVYLDLRYQRVRVNHTIRHNDKTNKRSHLFSEVGGCYFFFKTLSLLSLNFCKSRIS